MFFMEVSKWQKAEESKDTPRSLEDINENSVSVQELKMQSEQ